MNDTAESWGLSNARVAALVTLRMLIGWHFLYEGLVKVLNTRWAAAGSFSESQGLLSGLFMGLASQPLAVVDFANRWGLILIGVGLIAGLLTRYATLAGMLLLALYYLCSPLLPGLVYSQPPEGSYLIVNKVLIEAAALWVLLLFPTGQIIGLDRWLTRKTGDVR